MSRCIRDLFKPHCTYLVSQIVRHNLQRWSQIMQQVLGLLDSPYVSRPGWEVSPLHGASVLLLNHSCLYKDRVRTCYCYGWRHLKQCPEIAPTNHFQDHSGDGGSGEKRTHNDLCSAAFTWGNKGMDEKDCLPTFIAGN